jgi:D-glycero-D-manno-heptose 1,7-bisphosphate phosphatase
MAPQMPLNARLPDMNEAVFFDRDGTLIEERNYLRRPADMVILPGTAPALRRLQAGGFRLFIVSNQSGVGRGYFTMADVELVNAHLLETLRREGVQFEKVYVAPEPPGVPSRGRKPSPQFLWDARDEYGLELFRSYLVGDKLIDLECGWNAGVRKSLLVRTGFGDRLARQPGVDLSRAIVVDHLAAAADWILADKSSLLAARGDL